MATRKDVHRPSAIEPSEYEYVGFEHMKIESIGDCHWAMEERKRIRAHMDRTGGTYSAHQHGGNCMVCGAAAIYTILFYHPLTNSYVRTGRDCADKMEMGYGDFNAFRSAIHNAIEAKAGKNKAKAILADAGLSECWEISEGDVCIWEERTIRDIVGKLVRFGSISEKQTDFLRNLISRIENRATIEAERKAEKEAAAPCPTGRVVIKGTVITTREDDGAFGPCTKVLIQAESGFKVWGSQFERCQKGDKVEFKATVSPSENDPKFGFYKRPACIAIESAEPEPIAAVEQVEPAGKSRNRTAEELIAFADQMGEAARAGATAEEITEKTKAFLFW